MHSAGKLCIIVFLLVIFTPVSAQAQVIQQVGPYTVTVGSPPPGGIVDDHGADRQVSFWELPLWIQMYYLSGVIGALLVAVKVVPFTFLKLKSTVENKNRELIYRYIEENPGCTVNDVSRGESLNLGSVRYHVYRLALARKIREIKTGKFSRLFRNNGAYNEREIVVISALNIRTNKAIVSLLGEDPGLSNKQIADRLKIKVSLAHVYLSGLVKDHIIRFEKNEQRKQYFLESDVFGIVKKTSGRPSSHNPGI
ncbi:MAG TPA: winged helix-turn-helix transcriptional regulator [Methanocella sp.]|jgi:predicted transcriptional regulator